MNREKKVKRIIESALNEGRYALTEFESEEILNIYGLPILPSKLTKTVIEAVLAAEKIKYPVVLKVMSPDITHKTDAGCVEIGIKSDEMLKMKYMEMLEKARKYRPNANIWGVLVQKMADKGREVIVGMKRDPVFGPVILFGLGGIFVEVIKDISLRVVPLTREEALEMIKEIKGYPILEAYRGRKPADIESIADIILNVSRLAQDFNEILEIDLNPVFVYEKGKGAAVTDARIILKRS